MSGEAWWERPMIELPLSGREVSRCCIDNALRLYFSGSDEGYRPPDWWSDSATAAGEVRVAIEREFRFRYLGWDRKLSPEGYLEELGAAAVLYRKVVHRALAYQDGRLEVRFRDGTHIWVPSHPEYEPWQVAGPAGLLVVSVPGGEIAVWAPEGSTPKVVPDSRLELGQISITSAAAEGLDENGKVVEDFIARHRCGDWGDVTHEDREENEQALASGGWVRSAYVLDDGEILWIATDLDHRRTIVHLPHELRW